MADANATSDPIKRHELVIRWDRPTPIFLTGQQGARTLADFHAAPQLSPENHDTF
jgi:hypothetical protein